MPRRNPHDTFSESKITARRKFLTYFCGLISSSMPGPFVPVCTCGTCPFHLAIQRSVTASFCHSIIFWLMDAARSRFDS
jgi:hypothetical protein